MNRTTTLIASALLLLASSGLASAGEGAGEYTATLELGSTSATPGATVDIPVLVSASANVAGLSISIDFDETVLEAVSFERLWDNSDGTEWSFARFDVDNSDDAPGDSGIAEGFGWGAVIFSYENDDVYPTPGASHAIVALRVLVKPTATPGATEIRFIDGAKPFPENPEIPNHVTVKSSTDIAAAELVTLPASVLIDGVLQIIGDITMFVRGDSNADAAVDVSDVSFTLDFLFRGGPRPACMDAADANDDGTVNIADPVATLMSLFLDGGSLPPPSAAAGTDETDDSLTCGG